MKPPSKDISDIQFVLPAEILNVALPVSINIIGILDRDTCLSLQHQIKLTPYDGMQIDGVQFAEETFAKIEEDERPIRPTDVENEEDDGNKDIDEKIDRDIVGNVMACLVA